MSYVDAFYNRDQDVINVVERDAKGNRHYREYNPRHIFITQTLEVSSRVYMDNRYQG